MKHSLKTYLADKLLTLFIRLNNYSYSKISSLVVIANNGLHPKHAIMNYHKFFVDNISPKDTVLDIGCGNGANAFDISQKAKSLTGIDISKQNISYANAHYRKDNLRFIHGDVLTYRFSEIFNKVILSNVLEHIDNRIAFLKSIHRTTNTVLIRVPMLTRDWLAVYKKAQGLEYRLDKTHYIEYTTDILKKELNQSGWKLFTYSIQFGELWGVVVCA